MYSRQWGKINTEPAPIGALSQCCTHTTLFMESFLKKEAKFRLQQLRGWVIRSGFAWITTAFLLWPLVSTLWGTSQGIRPPFHYCRDPNLLLSSINIAFIHWWRGWMVESPSLQVPKSHQSRMLQEPWLIPLRPNPSKEIIVETSEERGLSHPRQDFSRCVLLVTFRRRIQRQSQVVSSFDWLIINDYWLWFHSCYWLWCWVMSSLTDI